MLRFVMYPVYALAVNIKVIHCKLNILEINLKYFTIFAMKSIQQGQRFITSVNYYNYGHFIFCMSVTNAKTIWLVSNLMAIQNKIKNVFTFNCLDTKQ